MSFLGIRVQPNFQSLLKKMMQRSMTGVTPADMSQTRKQAVAVAAETMGELVAFWGFKSSMGRIWTTLYLSSAPLTADELCQRTGLSSGAVSMGLADLGQWDLVARDPWAPGRKRRFQAETDVWGIIRRIFRERELRLVGRSIERFSTAIALLEQAIEEDAEDVDAIHALQRLHGLLALARTGYAMLENFAAVGRLDLFPIRGVLGGRGPE